MMLSVVHFEIILFFIFEEEVVLWEEEGKQTVIDQTFGMATVRAISLLVN